MTAQEWIHQCIKIYQAKDWEVLDDFRIASYKDFAKNGNSVGLCQFYDEVLDIALSDERKAPFLVVNDDKFRSEIRKSFQVAKQKIKELGNIKGIYIEYYSDQHKGDSSNSVNLFLCDEYSDEDDDWGSQFENEGFVEGALLPDYFFHDYYDLLNDEEWYLIEIVGAYAHGKMLALFIEEWKHSGINLPLGYSNHDYFGMVRVPVNAQNSA